MKCDHIRTKRQGDTPFFPNMLNNANVEVCLKEDVDAVMANQRAEAFERERHHNYKRCEAMAKWCEAKVYNIRRKPLCDMDDHEGWQHDDEFWQRWHKRWLELAEHFRDRTKMMEAK